MSEVYMPHCRACGAARSRATCDTCGSVHCSRKSCGIVLDSQSKPERCPSCSTFTVWNRAREAHGLAGREAKRERARKVPAIARSILRERGLDMKSAGRTARSLARLVAESELLRRKGFEVAEAAGPRTAGGEAGLRAFGSAADRMLRGLALLEQVAPRLPGEVARDEAYPVRVERVITRPTTDYRYPPLVAPQQAIEVEAVAVPHDEGAAVLEAPERPTVTTTVVIDDGGLW